MDCARDWILWGGTERLDCDREIISRGGGRPRSLCRRHALLLLLRNCPRVRKSSQKSVVSWPGRKGERGMWTARVAHHGWPAGRRKGRDSDTGGPICDIKGRGASLAIL